MSQDPEKTEEQVLVRVTYTKGKDAGASLQLPVYPADEEAWRGDVRP